jgi:carbamoyltransferase
MILLGISAYYHDSAAAIIRDGEIIAAVQEERFTRKKNDASFPVNAIRFCLEYAGCSIQELDAVVFYDKPFLKFERILESVYAFAPRSWRSFVASMPVWIKEKLFLKKMLRDALYEIEKIDKSKIRLLFPEHHLSHAASAFYPSSYQTAAILTIDGVGEWASTTISHGENHNITVLKQLDFPHSVGLLYSAFTYYIGFKVNSGEYKLMGLAPYGNADDEESKKFIDIIKNKLIDIKDDGSVFLDQKYFSYGTGLRMVNKKKWEKLFGLPRRMPETEITQGYCNLAFAIQTVVEEIVIKLAIEAKRLTNARFLCMAGGVALNSVANGKLHGLNIFESIFIQPAAGDAGGALGAALAAYYIYFEQQRSYTEGTDSMKGSFLGTEYADSDVQRMIKKNKAICRHYLDEQDLIKEVAGLLSAGQVVGWHQGRMEYGPRALGARSILADARTPEMQSKLNTKIKYRESFRPFAPAVLAEDTAEYFELTTASPYMLLVQQIKASRRKPLPLKFKLGSLSEKLNFQRSDIPAVTHVDYSARIQTVHKETNRKLYRLLKEFKNLTGYSLVINTSFNVRGEPIVDTPEQAYACFMQTDMDWLVINNFVFDKRLQQKGRGDKRINALTDD